MDKYYLVIASVEQDRPEEDEVPVPKILREPSFNFPFIGPLLQTEMADAVMLMREQGFDTSVVNIVFTDFTLYGSDEYEYIEDVINAVESFPYFIEKINCRAAVHRLLRSETYPEVVPLSLADEWVHPILVMRGEG
jgi:hypothetical protein